MFQDKFKHSNLQFVLCVIQIHKLCIGSYPGCESPLNNYINTIGIIFFLFLLFVQVGSALQHD